MPGEVIGWPQAGPGTRDQGRRFLIMGTRDARRGDWLAAGRAGDAGPGLLFLNHGNAGCPAR
jgi:hypothetical protein